MEVIRKKICLENYRSRRQGLLPFIPFNQDLPQDTFVFSDENNNNGNYGGFVIDLFQDDTYTNKMRKYNAVMKELMAGTVLSFSNNMWVKLNGVKKDIYDYSIYSSSDFVKLRNNFYKYIGKPMITDDVIMVVNDITPFDEVIDYASFCKGVDKYLGELQIPANIDGCLVPKKINLCDIKATIEQMESDLAAIGDCCKQERYINMGGDEMLAFLKLHANDYKTQLAIVNQEARSAIQQRNCVPYIEVPLLINSSFSDLGIMKTYYDGDDEYEMPSGLTEEYKGGDGAYTESKLNELRVEKYFYDDYGNALPGLYRELDRPKYYEYKGDGETGSWGEGGHEKKENVLYEVYTLKQCFPTPTTDGTSVFNKYAMTYFENDGKSDIMTIPYKEGTPFNVHKVGEVFDSVTQRDYDLIAADFITKIDRSQIGFISFTYVCGGQFIIDKTTKEINHVKTNGTIGVFELGTWIQTTGILYNETYPFDEAVMEVTIDGKENIEIYYEHIDFDSKKVTIKHESLDTTREGLLTNISGFTRDDVFNNEDECFYNAPIYKEDYLMPIVIGANADVDITVSRGTGSAFEKHLKLTECNTMNDLVNYSNNFFNL